MRLLKYSGVAARIITGLLIITLAAYPVVFQKSVTPVPSAEASAGDETTYYFLTDHLGSVDAVLDEQGNVVERRDYLPYGQERFVHEELNAPDTEQGYTGKELDDETGLNYYGARYYDPVTGRFITMDPLLLNLDKMSQAQRNAFLSNPQNLNMYSYVQNNPVRYTDPTGTIKKEASFLSKLVSVFTYDNFGKGTGWLAQGAKAYASYPNPQTKTELLNRQSEALGRLITDPSFADETWDSVTTERIMGLDSKVQIPATDFINGVEKNQNTTLRVTDGYRTIAEQDKKYAQGRTTSGNIVTHAPGGTSYHNYGLAIDVVIMEDSKVKWEQVSDDIVNLATGLGFEWGGYWENPDYPHFQMTFGQSIKDLQDKQSKE